MTRVCNVSWSILSGICEWENGRLMRAPYEIHDVSTEVSPHAQTSEFQGLARLWTYNCSGPGHESQPIEILETKAAGIYQDN